MVSSNYVHFLCVTSHSYANRNWNVWDDEFGCSIYALLFSPFNRAIVVLCRTCALLFSPHVIVSVESVVFILLNLKLNRKCRGITKHMYVCTVNSGDNHQHQMVKRNKTRGTTELNKMFDFIFISTVPTERVSERAHFAFQNVRAAIFRFHRNFSHRQSLLAKFRGVKYVHFRFRYGVLAVESLFFFVLSVTCLFSPRFMTACVAHFLASLLNIEIILSF